MQGLAQLTAVGVTMIVMLGNDTDLLIAAPLGLFAGALGVLLASAMEAKLVKAKA